MAEALPFITVAATLLSTGVSAAGAAGAFGGGPSKSDVPTMGDAEVEDARRRALIASRNQRGSRASILTTPGTADPLVGRPSVLGGGITPGGPQPASRGF